MSLVYPLTGLSRVDVSGIPINAVDVATNASAIAAHGTRLNTAESRLGTNEAAILTKQVILTGAATSVVAADLGASKALASTSGGKITVSECSAASLDFVAGLSSGLVSQLAAKEPMIALTTNRAVVSDGAGALAASAVTAIELALLAGVTSQVQTQLNAREPTVALAASRALTSSATGALEASAVTATELSYLDGATSSIQTQLAAKEPTVALTASRALTSSATGALEASAVTGTELGYLSGVTLPIQSQLGLKANVLSGGAQTIAYNSLPINRALISDASGNVGASSVTDVELDTLSGATSALQTQLNNIVSGTIGLAGISTTGLIIGAHSLSIGTINLGALVGDIACQRLKSVTGFFTGALTAASASLTGALSCSSVTQTAPLAGTVLAMRVYPKSIANWLS